MKIPEYWDSVFSETFYDKKIFILIRHDEYDNEGGLVTTAEVESTSFIGNVRFKHLEIDQETMGLRYDIDMSITTSPDTEIELNNIVQYKNQKYLVTDVMPYESHLLVACKIWKSE